MCPNGTLVEPGWDSSGAQLRILGRPRWDAGRTLLGPRWDRSKTLVGPKWDPGGIKVGP